MVEMPSRLAEEEEPPLRDRLELAQPPRAGADERARDRVGELDLKACEREPGVTSARSRRSTSIAADASETTIPSPPHVGHFWS